MAFGRLPVQGAVRIATANPARSSFLVQNDGTVPIRVGDDSTVGEFNGIVLMACAVAGDGSGGTLSFDDCNAEVWAWSATLTFVNWREDVR